MILGIDDDPDFNNILSHLIKKLGHDFKATTTVEEFLHSFKNLKPAVCFIDLNLDIASGAGFQLLQAIRKKYGYDVPLIVLSRRGKAEDIQRSLQLGANDFIFKPLDDIILAQKLHQYLPEEDHKKLPFSKITESEASAQMIIDFQIHSINEFGIVLRSKSLIAKGVPLELTSTYLEEIFEDSSPFSFTVRESWIEENEESKQKYNYSFLEYDFEDGENLVGVRRFLLSNQSET